MHSTSGHQDGPRGRQYLGAMGKMENGVVAVSSLWADERLYYPLEAALPMYIQY